MAWVGNQDSTGATRVSMIGAVTGSVSVSNFPATQPVSAASLPLPAGAATAALQLPDNHQVTVSNFPATQPVSAASLPLPTGAATAALQLPDNHQVTVSNFPATQAVSAASLPLPTGAATAALQLPDNHQVAVSNFPVVQTVAGEVTVIGRDKENNAEYFLTANKRLCAEFEQLNLPYNTSLTGYRQTVKQLNVIPVTVNAYNTASGVFDKPTTSELGAYNTVYAGNHVCGVDGSTGTHPQRTSNTIYAKSLALRLSINPNAIALAVGPRLPGKVSIVVGLVRLNAGGAIADADIIKAFRSAANGTVSGSAVVQNTSYLANAGTPTALLLWQKKFTLNPRSYAAFYVSAWYDWWCYDSETFHFDIPLGFDVTFGSSAGGTPANTTSNTVQFFYYATKHAEDATGTYPTINIDGSTLFTWRDGSGA